MKSMNSEIKKVVDRVKEAQVQLQSLIQGQDWVEEAQKYAKKQGKEVKKLFANDVEKMKKELEKIQKQIPSEVKKLKKYVNLKQKEFEELMTKVRKMNASGKSGAKSGVVKAKSKRVRPASGKRRSGSSASSSHEAST